MTLLLAQAATGSEPISSWIALAGQIGGLIVVVVFFLRYLSEANTLWRKDMEALVSRIEINEKANRDATAQLADDVKMITQSFREEHHSTVNHLLQTTREVVQTLGAVTAQVGALGLQVASLREVVELIRGPKKPGG